MKKVHRKGRRPPGNNQTAPPLVPKNPSAKEATKPDARQKIEAPSQSSQERTEEGKKRSQRTSERQDGRRVRYSDRLSILYEDDAVVVIDKPAGLIAVPIPGSNAPSAWSLLAERLESRRQRALIVHRIDRFSSGALLFAKTAPDRQALVKQFLAHTPVRQYLAAVRGRVTPEKGTLVHYFERDGMYQQLRSAKDPNASRAELRYSVERLFANASLVRVELVTGLQNQIRVQFSAQGHPIIGDRKYSRAESFEPLIARVALHAAHLEFIHPRTGKNIAVDCKLPPDYQHLIRELSRPKSALASPDTKAAASTKGAPAERARRNPRAPRRRA